MTQPAPLEVQTLSLPSGLSNRVISGGQVGGPKLIYFHAATGASVNDPFLLGLAERFHVYAPVAPGFDDLDDLAQMRTVHDLALHYDDIAQALSLDNFAVVGHSFGGMVAAEYAAHYPSKVASLALIAAAGLWDDAVPVVDMFATPALELAQFLWADPNSEAAQVGQQALLAAGSGADGADSAAADPIESMLRLVRGLVSAGKFMMPIPDQGLNRRLYRITAPTLVLWGDSDHLIPAHYAQLFAAAIANCEVKVLPDAGHLLTYEHTDQSVNLTADFLAAA